MVLYCTNCGEKEKFQRNVHGREYYTETELLDREGDSYDYTDHETTDSETDEWDDPTCAECGDDVEDMEIDEIREHDSDYADELQAEEYQRRNHNAPPIVNTPTLKNILGEENET